MKKRIWLVLLSALICLSMLFAGCEKATTGDNNSQEITTSGNLPPEEPQIDEDADKALIVESISNFLNGGSEEEPGNPMEELKNLKLSISDLVMKSGNESVPLLQSVVLNGTVCEIVRSEDEKAYITVGSNGDLLLVAIDPEGSRHTQIIAMDELFGAFDGLLPMAEGGLAMPDLTNLPEFPMITAEHLVSEGNGVYVVSEDYYKQVVGYVADIIAELSGMSAAEARMISSVLEGYLEDIDLRLAFTVANKELTQIEFALGIDNDLIKELMETDLGELNYLDLLDDDLHIDLSVKADMVDGAVNALNVTANMKIPGNNEYVYDETGMEITAIAVSVVNVELGLQVNSANVSKANETVMSLSCKMNTQATVFTVENDNFVAVPGEMPAQNVELQLTVSTVEADQLFRFDCSMTNEGQTVSVSLQLHTNDVPEITLPELVTKAQGDFESKYVANKEAINAELFELLMINNDLAETMKQNGIQKAGYELKEHIFVTIELMVDEEGFVYVDMDTLSLEFPFDATYVLTINGEDVSFSPVN